MITIEVGESVRKEPNRMGRWLPINHEGCIDMREGMEAKETKSVGILGSLGLTEVKHYISCICDMFFLFCIFLSFLKSMIGSFSLVHHKNTFFFLQLWQINVAEQMILNDMDINPDKYKGKRLSDLVDEDDFDEEKSVQQTKVHYKNALVPKITMVSSILIVVLDKK